jgi:phenylacetate-CoA ligase
MSAENLPLYFERLRKFRPKAIEGYPSTIYILAGYLLSRNQTFPLQSVFTSSETLYPQQREAIERAFECKLFDFYGLAERVLFATECDKHTGHHINMDFGILEVLNARGEPAARGEMGRMVGTGLHNYGMPLIRYETSDVTAIKPEPCPCGRGFPLMEDVTTKAEDIVTTRDGRYVSSSILTHPFKPMHNVAESQIIQEDREHIVIKIIKRAEYTDTDSRYLVEEMKKRVGSDMKIDIEFVDEIPRTKAGKFRWVISKVPLEF